MITRTALGHVSAKNLAVGVGVVTMNLTGSVTTGASMIVAVQTDGNMPDSVKYGTVALTLAGTGPLGFLHIYTLDGVVAAGSQIKIDMTSTAAGYVAAIATQLAGVAASPLDAFVFNNGSSTSFASAGTGTLGQPSEYVLVYVGDSGPSTDILGAFSNGFSTGDRIGTSGGTAALNATVAEADLLVNSTSSVQTAATNSVSRSWESVIMSYKDTVAPSAPRACYTSYDYIFDRGSPETDPVPEVAQRIQHGDRRFFRS